MISEQAISLDKPTERLLEIQKTLQSNQNSKWWSTSKRKMCNIVEIISDFEKDIDQLNHSLRISSGDKNMSKPVELWTLEEAKKYTHYENKRIEEEKRVWENRKNNSSI